MRLRDLQNSNRIREHLKLLHEARHKSTNKELLDTFIDFWSIEYIFKKELEKQQLKQLTNE